MAVQPCGKQPFEGTQQALVPFGSTIAKLTQVVKASPDWILEVCDRPFVPLWGVKLNADNITYDFAPSTKGNEQALISIAESCYNASKNFVELGEGVGDDIVLYVNKFPDYTYRKIGAKECLRRRYYEVYNKARQFFTLHGAIGAFDLALYKELDALTEKVMRETDKQMMIPPNSYLFRDGSAAKAALDAWFLDDETIAGLYGIEIVTT